MIDCSMALHDDFALGTALNHRNRREQNAADPKGDAQHFVFAEYNGGRLETIVRQPLIENSARDFALGSALIEPQKAELPATFSEPWLQKSWFGFEAAECFASPEVSSFGRRCSYQEAASFPPNRWALTGEWTLQRRSVLLHAAYGRIVFRFHGTDVYLAMQSGPACYSRFRVLLDGEIPACSHGADVDSHGYGVVGRRRMYQLVRQSMPASDRTLEIQFLDPGVEAYSFAAG